MRRSTFLAVAVATSAVLLGLIAVITTRPLEPAFALYVVGWAAYSLVGAFVAALRPRNPIGWLFAVMGVASELGLAAEGLLSALNPEPGGAAERLLALFGGFWFVAFELVPALLILFPDGGPPSRRWRIVLAIIGANAVLGTITSTTLAASAPIEPALVAVIGADAPAGVEDLQGYASLLMIGLFAAGAAALVIRTRRSRGVERQQLKWIALAGVIVALAFLGTMVAFITPLRSLDPDAPFPAAMFGGVPVVGALVSVPLAAAIAILRYRLYDVDLLIKRTVVYGATTAAIAVTFFVGLVALQGILSPVTSGSDVAIAASTLVAFALFQPIRRRLQDAVDHRFDRLRYDAARTLDAFADQLRDEVDLDDLKADLIAAVRQTMAPAHASLWLRERRR